MGAVYKAEDLLMGRIIAIKVVSPHLTAKPGARERFQREFRLAAQLNDPRVVIAHDAGEAGGAQYFVMEYVEGWSLDWLVAKKGPFPVTTACSYTRQAALGLQHAAEKGLVHRDIKPQNLMVTKNKRQVKILDFGLGRFASSDEDAESPPVRVPFGAGKAPENAGVTNPNMLMGTPDYLSPEQAKNSHDVDARSDIYSLGCTLYFLLTGKPPFLGSVTLIDKLLAHTNDEPPAIREVRPEVPQGLAEVLAKMMAKSPEDRYQKASEAAAAILPFTRATEPEPVFEIVDAEMVSPPQATAMPTPPPAPVAKVTAEAVDTTPPRGTPTLADAPRPKRKKKKRDSWLQRRKWPLIGGVAALLLLVGIAIAASTSKKPTDKPNDPPTSANAAPAPSKPDLPSKGSDKTADKGGKSTPNPGGNTVIKPPSQDEIVILYVIPSQGVWVPDYLEVRDQLVKKREGKKPVRVDTAATTGERSQPVFGPGPRDSIPIDLHISESMNLSKYSAVIFCGRNVDEYTNEYGAGRRATSHVIKEMLKAGKPVASICAGQAVLASHGVLKDRKVAIPPLIETDQKFRWMFDDTSIKWQKWPIVADNTGGKIVITAAGPPQAREFTDAILKAIEK
jgi:serine/threonine-protein kinase